MSGRSRGVRKVAPYVCGTDRAYEYGGCRCDACRAAHAERVARNRAARLAAGNLSHGTRSAWDAGCRCVSCVARREVYNEQRRAARREEAAS